MSKVDELRKRRERRTIDPDKTQPPTSTQAAPANGVPDPAKLPEAETARHDNEPATTETPDVERPAPADEDANKPDKQKREEQQAIEPKTDPPPGEQHTETPNERLDPDQWVTALDDPSIVPGHSDYRSFYVEDEPFARWRAAIFWLGRSPQARGDVPPNMSAALNNLFARQAAEWEQRYNGGRPFPPTDDQVKAFRKRQANGQAHRKRHKQR
ncbi:hypothetical protein GCM10012275_63770 [Longimycelium tulufanense]|uniref:Uncharacterized protein n=1 Tax=Longimycelium tulufanense TaxID=907463 RepID=A0A8J3CF50_9PSEU|nr:hypothetical protein [Longimycelium tulufanense]GGM84345.1 hypothetical protein GCM10012275_63770 [Longimycelium tulufanense]